MSWLTLASVAERLAEEQLFWCQKQALLGLRAEA